MAEHFEYSRSRSKSSKYSKKDSKYSDTRKSSYSKTKYYEEREAKTPPLPSKSNTSIEELLKKRESLKEELKNISKYSVNDMHSKNRNDDKCKSFKRSSDGHSRKRRSDDKFESDKYKTVKMYPREKSPEITEPLDSDEEENIIEQRRQQRKQLLAKLGHGIEHTPDPVNSTNGEGKNPVKTRHTKEFAVKELVDKTVSTDMFSERDEFNVHKSVPDQIAQEHNPNNTELTDDWDDAEGYYKIRVGDILNNYRYTIKSVLGQGMFANVVLALDKSKGNSDVAVKIARNNELMYRNALKEVAMLKEINDADPENKHHCVKIQRHFMHKGHLCIVLESLNMDLRCVLKKYGKNYGLNMKTLMSYSRQLLLALKLLKKVGIIHADIKPDNILVNEKKNTLKLCDFGSAEKLGDNDPKPYLVSRFYRAPEIILGMPYGHAIDLWSTACTIYELATGRIMFTGGSNNKMLKCFMDLKGKIPNRLIKKGKFKDQHFNYNNNFLQHKKDEVTGRDKVVEIFNINATRNLQDELYKYCKNLNSNEERKLLQLKDLLDKMIMLDPNQRLSINDCIIHPFIQEELKK